MGRLPHPVHVIALINGRRRPLAALDIGWCDPDSSMLDICSRLLRFFQDRDNQMYLELDLAYAEQLSEEVWSRDIDEELRRLWDEYLDCHDEPYGREKWEKKAGEGHMPMFPAIQTCLYLGAVWNGLGSYICSIGPRPWNSAYDHEECDPGSLILDISDSKVAYCFLLPVKDSFHEDGSDEHAQYERRRNTPLSAFEWLSAFGKEFEGAVVSAVDGFWEPAPVIDAGALQEAWPSFPCPLPDLQHEAPAWKYRRQGEGNERDQRIIQELVRCNSVENGKRTLQKASKKSGFRSNLKKYLDDHPGQLTSATPLAVTLLSAVLEKRRQSTHLRLHRFTNLAGDQIVELIRAIRPHYLVVLDLSFTAVTVGHLTEILTVTQVRELVLWDNPELPCDQVDKLMRSTGRVEKLTTRALFMGAFDSWLMHDHDSCRQQSVAAEIKPAVVSMRVPIRQLVWVNIMTQNIDDQMAAGVGVPGAPGALCLEQCGVETLAGLFDSRRTLRADDNRPNLAFAEALTFPLHDASMTLAEFYTSCSRIEDFMANCSKVVFGVHDTFGRYPLMSPVLMAVGKSRSEYAISSPLPAEIFGHASSDTISNCCGKSPWCRSPDPIVQGEYTMIVVHERDLDRVSYGMVTRSTDTVLETQDPEVLARTVGDTDAARAWRAGTGRLRPWTKEEQEDRDKEKKEGREKYKKAFELKIKVGEEAAHNLNWERWRYDTKQSISHRRATLLGVENAEKIYSAARSRAERNK